MLAANAPKQIEIPELPKARVRELAKRIRPIMRFAHVTPRIGKGDDVQMKLDRKGKLMLDERGSYYYLKPVDLFSTAFTWPGVPKADVRAPRLQKLRMITTYHPWAYYGFFKPTIAEVIAQVPADILDQVIAFELEPPADPLEPWDIVQHGNHVAETTFYSKRPRGKKADVEEPRQRRVLSDPAPKGVAIVREVGGQLVLDDPMAMGIVKAVGKYNCQGTLEMNADCVTHFVTRLNERGMTAADAVIVLLNVDDVHGGPLADVLMPGTNWQAIRDQGEVPFARGLAMRAGIQEALEAFDPEAAEKLRGMTEVAVVVVDHQVAEVFPAQ